MKHKPQSIYTQELHGPNEAESFAIGHGWVMTHNLDGSMILINTDDGKLLTLPADSVERLYKIATETLG